MLQNALFVSTYFIVLTPLNFFWGGTFILEIPARDWHIDIHTHLLPEVDDGSRSTEESLELLGMEYNQGIRKIIFTPHYRRTADNLYLHEVYETFLNEVKKKRPDIFENVEFALGHELVWHEDLIARLKEGQAFTLAGTNRVLIEFSPDTHYDKMYRQLRELCSNGYTPIVAHMERYTALYADENIEELRRMGCLMQVNYQSITGDGMTGKEAAFGGIFSKEIKRIRRLINEDYIDYYGTDVHRLDYRPPHITKALEWLKKNE